MGRRTAAVTMVVGLLVAGVATTGFLTSRDDDAVGRPVASPPPSSAAAAPAPSPATPAGAGAGSGEPASSLIAPPAVRDASPESAAQAAAPDPVSLAIPALGISAAIEPVGVEADGSMTIPRDGDQLGWYRHGPAPGAAQGSAVVAGHVDTRADGPGALFRLRELQPGDEVLVTATDGTQQRYRVTGRELINKSALPTDVLFRRDGPPALTIITCGGPFQPELRSYRDNVVVVAEPVQDGSSTP